MKKRIVAVLLSLALSTAMLAEAGAASLTGTPAAQSGDIFTSTADSVTGGETDAATDGNTDPTGDVTTEAGSDVTGNEDGSVPGGDSGAGSGTEGGTGTGDFTSGDGNTNTDTPSGDGAEGDINTGGDNISGGETTPDGNTDTSDDELIFTDDLTNESLEIEVDTLTAEDEEKAKAEEEAKKKEEAEKKAKAAQTAPYLEKEASNVVYSGRWKQENGKWKLHKPTGFVEGAELEEDPGYFTAADGFVQLNFIDYNGNAFSRVNGGTYLFDENGYLMTGEADGYYFIPASEAVISYNTAAGKTPTPYNSKLGQKLEGVIWDGTTLRWYNEKNGGRRVSLATNAVVGFAPGTSYTSLAGNQISTGKMSGYQYYYLDGNGKPFVGRKSTTYSGRKGTYCFQPAANSADIPGKMLIGAWSSYKTNRGTRWVYFGGDGRYVKKDTGAYRLYPSKDVLYVLDKNGYLVKNRVVKDRRGYYYKSNKNGQAYRNQLVKHGGYRYYFIGDGRRATYRNRWVRLGSNTGNRYFYFGSVRGRVQEKHGFQKITVNGKFIGWFYFTSGGNHYIDHFAGGRYFLPDGRMASGLRNVNGTYYFFERSSSTVARGKMYKGTWIKYNGKYYYAGKAGNLATNGWRYIGGNYYYFQNCAALTNYNIKRGSTYGRLDSRGKFITGWMVVNNNRNKARYMDPATGRFLKNTSKKIDGLLYYFDSNGYRKTDLTNIYKGPYYLEVDRINGVMTAYNSNRTVPVKTIRVSVGNPISLTRTGTFKVTRAGRWQLLMGPSWGQYGSHVTGGIYVHSVASGQMNANNLPAGEYLKLGSPASHGCIRCCVADAKWVWENCNGAKIKIFDGTYKADECFKGPLGRNPITPLRGSGTFDPTDPIYN